MWASPADTRTDIVDACRRAWELADATIAALPLDAPGIVPWWGPEPVTLHRVLVHVTAEAQRHAGHADIVRELIDHSAGLLEGFDNLRIVDPLAWAAFYEQVENAARQVGDD
jgi:hypothetical protein